MQQLNLPEFEVRIRHYDGYDQIFDSIRGRYVACTPEEWVRQHFINYLVVNKSCPKGLISVELPLTINRVSHRADIVVFDNNAKPLMLIECKAPGIVISNEVLLQVSRYNILLKAPFLVVTNGLNHYCMRISDRGSRIDKLISIPDYKEMIESR